MSDAAPGWDDFQRDVLDALGHVVYRAQTPEVPALVQTLATVAKASVAQLPKLPALDQLRTPAAKRALWPQLRALRKAARA